MNLSIEEIESRLDPKFIQITPTGWVHSHEHYLGSLFKDPHTKKMYFRTKINPSNPSYEQIMKWRRIFLSVFRYTQQLSFTEYFNILCYVVELHGFREDM